MLFVYILLHPACHGIETSDLIISFSVIYCISCIEVRASNFTANFRGNLVGSFFFRVCNSTRFSPHFLLRNTVPAILRGRIRGKLFGT